MNKKKGKMVRVPCQRCNTGAVQNPNYDKKPCPACGGKGYVMVRLK